MECCIEWSNYKETEKHARLCKRAVKQRPAWDLHLCWLFPQSLIFSVLWADFLSPYLFPSIKVSDDSWQSIGGKRIILLKGIYRGHWGFPSGSEDKESTCNAGDASSLSGLGRSPGEGYGCPFQYSCLKNPMDRGAWQITVQRVTKSRTWLSN